MKIIYKRVLSNLVRSLLQLWINMKGGQINFFSVPSQFFNPAFERFFFFFVPFHINISWKINVHYLNQLSQGINSDTLSYNRDYLLYEDCEKTSVSQLLGFLKATRFFIPFEKFTSSSKAWASTFNLIYLLLLCTLKLDIV